MKLFRTLMTAGIVAATGVPAIAADISGAGATFPYPVYAKWADAYKKETGIGLNYQSIGSGGGIKQIYASTVTFGATDAPLKGPDLEKRALAQFPMVMGGIVPVINVPGIKPGELVLDGPTLARVIEGTTLHAAVARVDGGKQLFVDAFFDRSELLRIDSLATGSPDLGSVQRPVLRTCQLVFSTLVGLNSAIDFRLLGFMKHLPVWAFRALVPWPVAGFLITLVTGLIFLVATPDQYLNNISWWLKMLFLMIAGLNVLLFELTQKSKAEAMAPGADTSPVLKMIGGVSLVSWFMVLVWGRMLAFLGNAF